MSRTTLDEYVGRTCREWQKWFQISKLRLQTKGLFRTITNTLFDKTILRITFWIVLAIKYEKKSLLGWKHLLYVKDWKTNNCHFDASFRHKIAFRTICSIWNQAIYQKDQIWCKITFLHENATFIEFWDCTVITYFRSRKKSPRKKIPQNLNLTLSLTVTSHGGGGFFPRGFFPDIPIS